MCSTKRTWVQLEHAQRFSESLVEYLNSHWRCDDIKATASAEQVTEQINRVWLIGSRKNDPFAEVHSTLLGAEKAVMKYLFEDEDDHWLGKLSLLHKEMMQKVKDDPKTAIEFYNSVCPGDSQWVINEAEVIRTAN